MLVAVALPAALAFLSPWIVAFAGRRSGWLLALLPLALFGYFVRYVPQISDGEVVTQSVDWVPSLGIAASFYLDGLSLTFALLITSLGALVVLYSGSYLRGHPQIGRFYLFLLLFMASMLGVVLANNVVTLFVFWELTSLTSYFLIGFDHARDDARAAALQALLVTGIGGMALLAGLLLLGLAGGSLEFTELLAGEDLTGHALYAPALALFLVGAFTKSAQFPFHFWLPNAMEAPTPVSAYLHAATMVKAGVYLIARFSPVLGGTDPWLYAVGVTGTVTMFVGAYLALQQSDLKRILAYATVSVLGMLTMLLGLGSELAVKAAMVLLIVHALYKGSLFLVAGAVDHEAGARELSVIGGLRRTMPITAAAAAVAAVSMAGVPPMIGYISKETTYEALQHAPEASAAFLAAGVISSVLLAAVAGVVAIRPFFGTERYPERRPHEAPLEMWVGPALLAAGGVVLGIAPALISGRLVGPAAAGILGSPAEADLALWHGFNLVLLLSALTLAAAAVVYVGQPLLSSAGARLQHLVRWGPEQLYVLFLRGLDRIARAQTRVLQSGYLRVYLVLILVTTSALAGFTMISRDALAQSVELGETRFFEWGFAAAIVLATLVALFARSYLFAIAALGVVGFNVAVIYILFGAPDLAMTQFLVETLTVILFVFIFYHLPRFTEPASGAEQLRDAAVALVVGALVTAFVLAATSVPVTSEPATYYAEQSKPEAHGRNIVNVILVDFRALDTLGEITVLGVAGIGVYALLKLRPREHHEDESEDTGR